MFIQVLFFLEAVDECRCKIHMRMEFGVHICKSESWKGTPKASQLVPLKRIWKGPSPKGKMLCAICNQKGPKGELLGRDLTSKDIQSGTWI